MDIGEEISAMMLIPKSPEYREVWEKRKERRERIVSSAHGAEVLRGCLARSLLGQPAALRVMFQSCDRGVCSQESSLAHSP